MPVVLKLWHWGLIVAAAVVVIVVVAVLAATLSAPATAATQYTIRSVLAPGMYISAATGTNGNLSACVSATGMRFLVSKNQDGSYCVKNAADPAQMLRAVSTYTGGESVLVHDGEDNRTWYIAPSTADDTGDIFSGTSVTFQLVANQDVVLDLLGSYTAENSPVGTYSANGGKNQMWQLVRND